MPGYTTRKATDRGRSETLARKAARRAKYAATEGAL